MLLTRSKEEIVQVKTEMTEYLKFLMAIRSELKKDVENYLLDSPEFPTKDKPLVVVKIELLAIQCCLSPNTTFVFVVFSRKSSETWQGHSCITRNIYYINQNFGFHLHV
jgi:hypothetical protein